MTRNSYLLGLLIGLASFSLSESAGQLHIHFLRYVSLGRTAAGVKCDPPSMDGVEIDEICDPQFWVEVQKEMKGGAVVFNYRQSNYYFNKEQIDFKSIFAGQPNPVVVDLDYDDNEGNVWLEVTVMDYDSPGNVKLMSKFAVNLEASGTDVKYMNLSKGNDKLSFRYWFSCKPNYYKLLCNKHCVGENDINIGHTWCDSDGEKFCRFGWINITSNCKQKHPCRTCVCKNGGSCTAQIGESYTCSCPSGSYGSNCEKCRIGASQCVTEEASVAVAKNCDIMLVGDRQCRNPNSSAKPSCSNIFLALVGSVVALLLY